MSLKEFREEWNGTTIDERRRQAYALRARGTPIKTIARVLGINRQTVSRYLDEYKEEVQGTIAQINRQDYAGMTIERFDQLRREVWSNYEKASKPQEKNQFLRTMIELETKERDALMELGLLERQPQKHEYQLEVIGDKEMAQIDAMAASLLSGSMGIDPERALSMCVRRQPYLTGDEGSVVPDDEVVGEFMPVPSGALDKN